MTTKQKTYDEVMKALYVEFNKANEEFAKITETEQTLLNRILDQRETLGKIKGISIALELLRNLWIDDINGEDK